MMSWAQWSQLEWAHPWWALLALQPLLMGLLLKLRRNQILHYADAHLLPWAVRGMDDVGLHNWRGMLNGVAWLLLAAALAGPRLPLVNDPGQQAMQKHELEVMVLLDVSPSMMAQDISPQRLQRAKLELLDLLPRLHGERLGLIGFSGSAGLLMPLNRDYAALRYYLNIAEPALFDTPGTALASALDLAVRNFAQDKASQHAILLLTDADTSALSGPAGAAVWEAADRLKQAGVRLFILGVGTAAGSTIPQATGNVLAYEGVDVVSMLDKSGFTELANKTDGKFVQVEDGDADWRALYDHGLLTVPGGRQSTENVHAWHELYANFLLPALLLFVWMYFPLRMKKNQPLLAVLCVAYVWVSGGLPDANASEADAYIAYRSSNHALAQTLYGDLPGYAARMGEGAAAYRRKDYTYAIRQFSAALLTARDNPQRERALFNLGNAYFMAGGYRPAADAFLGVLKYTPTNTDARANLALAAGKLAGIKNPAKKSQGIPGRRGREIGGALGEDANDRPLAMDDSDDKKNKLLRPGSDLGDAEKARLRSGGNSPAAEGENSAIEQDIAYRAALKKLELASDHPVPLHQSLIKLEAAREYVPLPEMQPW